MASVFGRNCRRELFSAGTPWTLLGSLPVARLDTARHIMQLPLQARRIREPAEVR
jgi:hypothetical protein